MNDRITIKVSRQAEFELCSPCLVWVTTLRLMSITYKWNFILQSRHEWLRHYQAFFAWAKSNFVTLVARQQVTLSPWLACKHMSIYF